MAKQRGKCWCAFLSGRTHGLDVKAGGRGAVCVLFANGYLGKMDGVNEDGRGILNHVACFSISQRRLIMRWIRAANGTGASALKPDVGAKAGAHSQPA